MKNPNSLIRETSPYLLQHAYNPVKWLPWGEEAFKTSRERNLPLFISIGYSTCHWCHVMEHESFEDEEVASILNERFIPVKVDREEHPDVDHYYMEVCQHFTGRGGWPLSVFAREDKKAFFAGTYFPKESIRGRMGFKDLLLRISDLWNSEPGVIDRNISEISKELIRQSYDSSSPGFDAAIFKNAFNYFSGSFDEEYGGFKEAPKFPAPHNLLFLLRYWYHYKDPKALHIVETTVKNICLGGIYDHIGGGFHRYSTDREWLVPHFEKMLYDQAMMILVLTDLLKITGSPFYKYFLTDTIEYVFRELKSPEGGFYSAQDADSEGVEGKYYVWNYNELKSLLADEEFEFLEYCFGFKQEGNFRDEHSSILTGSNILHLDTLQIDDFDNILLQFRPIKQKLLNARNFRVPPLLDNKILADWNGLFIYALSGAAFELKNKSFMEHAERAYNNIFESLYSGSQLFHSFAAGKVNKISILDDYAFMGLASLNLFQLTGKSRYIKEAVQFEKELSSYFFNTDKNLFRLSRNFADEEIFSIFDNAYPSGNSAAFLFLSRLNHITINESYLSKLNPLFENLPDIFKKYPSGAAFLLQFLFDLNFEFKEVIITLPNKDCPNEVLEALRGSYKPDRTILLLNCDNISTISIINPFFTNFEKIFSSPDLKISICLDSECIISDLDSL